MKFEGDVAAFEAACLKDIRESLERCDHADYDCSPFRTLVAVELEGTFPDTAIVVKYRYRPRYDPKQEELRATFPIWSEESPALQALRTVERRDVERGWGAGGVPLVHRARLRRTLRP